MTEEQAQAAIAEAERAGFDLSLVDSNLSLSIEDRLLRHDAALELKVALRAAGEAMQAQAARTPAPALHSARRRYPGPSPRSPA